MFFEDEEEKIKVLKEITKFFGDLTEFTAHDINREISYFVFRKYEKDKKMGNVNIYKILKFVMTGDSNVNDLGEICQFLGKKESMSRLKSAMNFSIGKSAANNKLFEEKKSNKLLLVSNLELDKIKLIENGNAKSNTNTNIMKSNSNNNDNHKDKDENISKNLNEDVLIDKINPIEFSNNENNNDNYDYVKSEKKKFFNKSLNFNKNKDI